MPGYRLLPPDAPVGPYFPAGFRLATGATAGETLHPAARFLFAGETIAVPSTPPLCRLFPRDGSLRRPGRLGREPRAAHLAVAGVDRRPGTAHRPSDRARRPLLPRRQRDGPARPRAPARAQPFLGRCLDLRASRPTDGDCAGRVRSRRRVRRAHALAGGLARGRPGAGRSHLGIAHAPARHPRALPQRAPRRGRLAARDPPGVGARAREPRLGGPPGARLHPQRGPGRRRRGLGRALRARHRAAARGRPPLGPAGLELLHARQREREGDPSRAGAARQLPRGPEQRAGLVPALLRDARDPARRPRRRPGAGRAQPPLPAVLAPPARVPALLHELRLHQRGPASRAGLGAAPRAGPPTRFAAGSRCPRRCSPKGASPPRARRTSTSRRTARGSCPRRRSRKRSSR